ncbi:hypothetical protein CYMTET_13315 [Cymbomonas tetramitiformis]|uniref:Uncharacterized protein n=1 Tax=Cymbomonas tetramitiformis TaxID=36881 RepID=A0AAE0GIN1_9CHLO|nr:hypothetical protein CYMTET_13315 [Cymbomonas tetramitiformis]
MVALLSTAATAAAGSAEVEKEVLCWLVKAEVESAASELHWVEPRVISRLPVEAGGALLKLRKLRVKDGLEASAVRSEDGKPGLPEVSRSEGRA